MTTAPTRRGRRWRIALPLLLLAALAALLARGLQLDPHALPSALVGRPVPALQLPALLPDRPGLDTRPGALAGPAVINVWASWCAPCREEHASLLALSHRHPRWPLLGLNYKDTPAAARAFLQQLGNPYAAIGSDAQGQAGIELGVYGVPETFVIDRQGRIAWRHAGPLTPEALQRIEALMTAP